MTVRIELPIELDVAGLPRQHRAHQSAVADFGDCVRSTPGVTLREHDLGERNPGEPGPGEDDPGARDLRKLGPGEPGVGSGPAGKGALHETFLVIDGPSAAAIAAAAVALFRSWMNRDRRRTVRVQVKTGDPDSVELTVDGDNISLKTLERAIESAVKLQTGE